MSQVWQALTLEPSHFLPLLVRLLTPLPVPPARVRACVQRCRESYDKVKKGIVAAQVEHD